MLPRFRLAVLMVVVGGAATFAACLDDPNDPLPNEARNRGPFQGGIAIGAGPGSGGSGGSGAGLGTGGTNGSGGTDVAFCACGLAYSQGGDCATCINNLESTDCSDALMACSNDTQGCPAFRDGFFACFPGDVTCVRDGLLQGAGSTLFMDLVRCVCTGCPAECPQSSSCQ